MGPVVFDNIELEPIAVLLIPLVLDFRTLTPTDVLYDPSVLNSRE
jgi:hypothetical protein